MRALALALTVLMVPATPRAQDPPAAVASIAVEAGASGVTLRGQALALTDGRFDARMRIEKSGPSGTTSTTQGGALALAARETGTVATVGLSLQPGDRLDAELTLSAGGRSVSTSRVTIGQ